MKKSAIYDTINFIPEEMTMIEFQIKLGLIELLVPAICAGTLLAGVSLFTFLYIRSRITLYLAMSFLGLFALVFVGSEMIILASGGWLRNAALGMQFHRIEQIAGAFFIFGLPFLVSHLLELNAGWRRANSYIAYAALTAALAILVIAFAAPDLFISMKTHNAKWLTQAGNHGRGQEGVLYQLRDLLLFVFIIYSLTCMTVDLAWHRRFGYLLPPIIGVLLAISGAVIDIVNVYTGVNYDFLPDSSFSRFSLGVTLFILFCMGALTRQFVQDARETSKAGERARRDAERSMRQNDFIKKELKSSSAKLVSAANNISTALDSFADNTRDQAAATEEVSASIEEITAGSESVARSTGEQHQRLASLVVNMDELSGTIRTMGDEVAGALGITGRISEKARSGEGSIREMHESMNKIGQRSGEMRGIIRIINDISDRINLLSLNAAIEAARAGDAGRGFAVVADEISKLADATASSIKEIDGLIRASEGETASGAKSVASSADAFVSVIKDLDVIAKSISTISEHMKKQLEAGGNVSANSEQVRIRSEEIKNAITEQKNAIAEIAKSVSEINDLSQQNSLQIDEMTQASKTLLGLVEGLNREIDEYED